MINEAEIVSKSEIIDIQLHENSNGEDELLMISMTVIAVMLALILITVPILLFKKKQQKLVAWKSKADNNFSPSPKKVKVVRVVKNEFVG